MTVLQLAISSKIINHFLQYLQPAEADAVLFLVCLYVRLSVCLSVRLSVRMSVRGFWPFCLPRLPIPLPRWRWAVRSSLELILVCRQ